VKHHSTHALLVDHHGVRLDRSCRRAEFLAERHETDPADLSESGGSILATSATAL
jgi:hypothetical protein